MQSAKDKKLCNGCNKLEKQHKKNRISIISRQCFLPQSCIFSDKRWPKETCKHAKESTPQGTKIQMVQLKQIIYIEEEKRMSPIKGKAGGVNSISRANRVCVYVYVVVNQMIS